DKVRAAAKSKKEAEARKKAADFQNRMQEGRLALSARQYDTAIKAFQAAQALMPGDPGPASLLKEAEKGKADAAAVVAEQARKQEADRQRAAEVNKALTQGRAALAAGQLDAAAKAINSAAQLAPGDAGVIQAQRDLQQAQARQAEKARNDARAAQEAEAKKKQ